MFKRLAAAALCTLAASVTSASAAPRTLYPDEFQSFIRNWTPPEAPFCAVLRDENAWSAVMHPAAVMGGDRPFAPDRGFWNRHAVLLFARTVPGSTRGDAIEVDSVRRGRGGIEVRLHTLAPTMLPPGGSRMKAWAGVVVDPSLPQQVFFIENGRTVCNVDLSQGFITAAATPDGGDRPAPAPGPMPPPMPGPAPRTLDPANFQSFVRNWTPPEAPFCAVLQGQNDWADVMHPAPAMFGNKPFAPDPRFWERNAVLLFARTVPSGNIQDVFQVESVQRRRDVAEVRLRTTAPLTPQSPGASMMKAWTGIVVDRQLPQQVRFIENGRPVCDVDLNQGFTSPPLSH